jgi:hypothetical protein
LHAFPHEVYVEIDVLRALVVYRVGGHVHGRHIVALSHRSLRE